LLSNAVKFSPAGQEVVVTIVRRGDVIRLTVHDHGPGIPEDFKPRIFEKFAQADTGERRQKGSGLGLNIVKQIVTRLDGKVGFESVSGRGALFYVELPRVQSAPALLDGGRSREVA
jgi:signal transduction histidine kinase